MLTKATKRKRLFTLLLVLLTLVLTLALLAAGRPQEALTVMGLAVVVLLAVLVIDVAVLRDQQEGRRGR